jgi:hypothetical protein
MRQGQRPRIEAGGIIDRQVGGLEQGYRSPLGGQRQRRGQADQATADDTDIVSQGRQPAIRVSMSLTDLGKPAVNTSLPSLVTSTSSSMRIPISHHLRCTPLVPAGM